MDDTELIFSPQTEQTFGKMSSMDTETSMSVPLDEDGFLRRECPTCEREFKWFVSPDDEAEQPKSGGYYCPYCGVQAPPDHFWTKAQVELAQNVVLREVVGPEVERWGRTLRNQRRSGDLMTMDVKMDVPPPMDPLIESDEMSNVTFACHPSEPVKVLDGWGRDVHCLICGSTSQS